jgi:hypothetical protein
LSRKQVLEQAAEHSKRVKAALKNRKKRRLTAAQRKALSEAGAFGAWCRWNLYREVEKLEQ